jgi:hypothetical protein
MGEENTLDLIKMILDGASQPRRAATWRKLPSS